MLIMREMAATRQKVNGNLFDGCCGLKDEAALYVLLRRMAQGHLSKLDFDREGTREKNQLKDREVKENEGQLQRRINNLEAENRRLKAQLSELKKKLPEASVQSDNRGTSSTTIMPAQTAVSPVQNPAYSQPPSIAISQTPVVSPMPSPPKRRERKRKASYNVTYKPTTDSSEDLYDSDEDPGWKRGKNEKSSSDEEEDDDTMNKAFVSTPKPITMSTAISDEELEVGPRIRLNPYFKEDIVTLPQKPGRTDFREEDKDDEEEDVHAADKCRTQRVVERRKSRGRSSAVIDKTFKEGDEVQALYINGGKDKWSEWLDCNIVNVIMSGNMYKVQFNSDKAIQLVKRGHVRARETL